MGKTAGKTASNLALRLATAAVGVPAILGLLYKAPPWGFYLLVFPAAMVAAWELFTMTHGPDTVSRVMGTGLAAIASLVMFFYGGDVRVVTTLLIAIPLSGPILTLVRLGSNETAALRAASLSFGPLFILPLTLLAVMRR